MEAIRQISYNRRAITNVTNSAFNLCKGAINYAKRIPFGVGSMVQKIEDKVVQLGEDHPAISNWGGSMLISATDVVCKILDWVDIRVPFAGIYLACMRFVAEHMITTLMDCVSRRLLPNPEQIHSVVESSSETGSGIASVVASTSTPTAFVQLKESSDRSSSTSAVSLENERRTPALPDISDGNTGDIKASEEPDAVEGVVDKELVEQVCRTDDSANAKLVWSSDETKSDSGFVHPTEENDREKGKQKIVWKDDYIQKNERIAGENVMRKNERQERLEPSMKSREKSITSEDDIPHYVYIPEFEDSPSVKSALILGEQSIAPTRHSMAVDPSSIPGKNFPEDASSATKHDLRSYLYRSRNYKFPTHQLDSMAGEKAKAEDENAPSNESDPNKNTFGTAFPETQNATGFPHVKSTIERFESLNSSPNPTMDLRTYLKRKKECGEFALNVDAEPFPHASSSAPEKASALSSDRMVFPRSRSYFPYPYSIPYPNFVKRLPPPTAPNASPLQASQPHNPSYSFPPNYMGQRRPHGRGAPFQ